MFITNLLQSRGFVQGHGSRSVVYIIPNKKRAVKFGCVFAHLFFTALISFLSAFRPGAPDLPTPRVIYSARAASIRKAAAVTLLGNPRSAGQTGETGCKSAAQ